MGLEDADAAPPELEDVEELPALDDVEELPALEELEEPHAAAKSARATTHSIGLKTWNMRFISFLSPHKGESANSAHARPVADLAFRETRYAII